MKTTIMIMAALIGFSKVKAQTSPLLNQYFNNTYLANPAMAGLAEGATADLTFRSQWNNIPGAPIVQNLSATYGWERVGVGLNMNLDKAGLQRQTRILASYAYHLPLNESAKLNFGLSAGFMNQRVDMQDLIGNPNDPQVGAYNSDHKTYFDGDFGIGITSQSFNVDFALVNLKNYFKKDNFKLINTPVIYASTGYIFHLGENLLQPKVAYRSFTDIADIVDVGAQFGVANQQVLFTAMYHTSKAASFGVGLHYKKKYNINTAYTTQTGALSGYTAGSFEINLGINW
ncbi:PorP/SprF family type IX secretion system membrane protein [Pedobacter sp. GR22-10]|uniref:PorP/SprF family type IX secretion system membrane protein n=2 Tax=Pedobacter TaxID=84567 RepID=UPI0022462539|nr:PorP/SprF family type IX secretion system membrane protein [Pedobacter sp. GR22-10]MCX2433482.1 PorP/SprF family type IX secretion system membrane protein [Pedobacter sp. GR22-10]